MRFASWLRWVLCAAAAAALVGCGGPPAGSGDGTAVTSAPEQGASQPESASDAAAPGPETETGSEAASEGGGLRVRGTVRDAAKPPKPGSVPYKDATISIHLDNAQALAGKLPAKEILVVAWGMRDNKLAKAASLTKGQTATFVLTPWEVAEEEYGGYNRIELEDLSTLSLDTYWGELQ